MSDTVKKLFTVLIVVVICIVVGAFAINILVPNALTGVTNAVEDTIYSATGIGLDLNGDGTAGSNTTVKANGTVRNTGKAADNANNASEKAGKVEGFTGSSGK
jgi:hypothetical protein